MTTRRRGPLIPLYLAYSPELLLLARCFWVKEDCERARMLVDAMKLPLLASPLFRILTAPGCPRFESHEWPAIRDWFAELNPDLVPVLERIVEVPMAVVELVALTECAQMLERGRVLDEGALLDGYPALERWQDVVLGGTRRVSKLAQAAAWELRALEAELAGDPVEADDAAQHAREAVARRVA